MKFSFNKKHTAIAVITAVVLLFAIICINLIIVRPEGLVSLWGSVKQIFKTVLYGLVVAYIISPIADFFNKKGLRFIQRKKEFSVARKITSIILAFILFFFVIFLFFAFIAPQVIKSFINLKETFMQSYDTAESIIMKLRGSYKAIDDLCILILDYIKKINMDDIWPKITESLYSLIQSLIKTTTDNINSIITSISVFVNEVRIFFIGIFLSIYLLYYKEMLFAQITKVCSALFSVKTCKYLAHVVKEIDLKLVRFIRGKAIDSLLVGIVFYIIYKAIGLPFAEILALVGGIMNMVPVFGPISAAFIGGFIVLITAPFMLIPYIFIVSIVGILDSNFVEPVLLGDSLGLKSVWIILAVTIMSALFGLFGMFFGVPIFAVFYTLVGEQINARLEKKKAEGELYVPNPPEEKPAKVKMKRSRKSKKDADKTDEVENTEK